MNWLTFKFYMFDSVQYLFLFAFGACLGSLVNVLVYRLPLGLGVVTPPSRCTSCGTRLTWKENFPVFGWLRLGGKCRFCRSPISPEYPIVEAITGLLFVALYIFLMADTSRYPAAWLDGRYPSLEEIGVRPEWAWPGFASMWPIFVLWLLLFTCLMAILLVDAKTFTIPMQLAWWPAIFGLVAHVGFAVYCQFGRGSKPFHVPGWTWAIASPGPDGWWWIGGVVGGIVGVGLSTILLAKGVIRRSFADYEEWEKSHLAAKVATAAAPAAEQISLLATDPADSSQPLPPPDSTPPAHADATPVPAADGDPTELWIAYPHARREMLRELIFLGPVIGLGLLGASLAYRWAGPWTPNALTGHMQAAVSAPLWLQALAGVLMGYLIGGGIVWAVRILGTLAFGKEAMGLGDVHMMAAVGACLGWIDSGLAFFGAAFVGLAWNIGQVARGSKRALPYGPYLAVATLLVVLFKYWIERAMNAGLHFQVPLNLP